MVQGINVFRERFRSWQDQYILIGGMACDLLFDEAGESFRPTRDIDMVLIVEALTTEFAKAFWSFIEEGGYEARKRSSGKPEFYRFVNPKAPGFPEMIELFARPESKVRFSYSGHLVPLHIDDEVSSLSAILLNKSYYEFLLAGQKVADEISVADAQHLVPMKMKAWLDLTEKKSQGIHVNERDLRKHRLDVFRLFSLFGDDEKVAVPKEVYDDIQVFIREMQHSSFTTKTIGLPVTKEEILDAYRKIYHVTEQQALT